MAQKKKKSTTDDTAGLGILQSLIKNPIKSLGGLLVVGIIIYAFVFQGSDISCSGKEDYFGEYDNIPIDYMSVALRYKENENRYRQNDMNSFFIYQLWRHSFEEVVVQTAIMQELKRAGYSVPPGIVDRAVARSFIEEGRFNSQLYNSLSPSKQQALWHQTKDEVTRMRYINDVFGLLKPDGEKEFIANMSSVQRDFNMAVFSKGDFPDSECIIFAQENPRLFQNIRHSVISLNTREEAEKVLNSIRSGEITLEEAASIHSKDKYAEIGGEIGTRMAHELRFDILNEWDREKIIDLEKDSYSDIVQTVSGDQTFWSFYYALDDVQEANLEDLQTLNEIRNYMNDVEGGRIENWALRQADDFIELMNETGFEQAIARSAPQSGVTSSSFGPIPLNYGSVDLFSTLSSQSVSELRDADTNEFFWKAAFSTELNKPSVPVVQGDNVLVIVPVSEMQTEEDSIEAIISTLDSYWIDNITERYLQMFFLTSPRMKDNFQNFYINYLMPQG